MCENGHDEQPAGPSRCDQEAEPAGSQASGAGHRSAGTGIHFRQRIAFSFVAVVLALGVIELGLRGLGFRYDPSPFRVETMWGTQHVRAMNRAFGQDVFQRDALLFWRLKPGTPLDVRTVNELGLLGGPVAIPKPGGTYRILCLGDSCTAIGPIDYPMMLQTRLDFAQRPGRRFEVVNGGTYGYTSLQGLRLFRDRLEDLAPDLVTLYYGWNDQYLAGKCPDKMIRVSGERMSRVVRRLHRLRLYQLARRVVHWAETLRPAEPPIGKRPVRVAAGDFRANVRALVSVARSRGARPLLLTLPSNHRTGHVPSYYFQKGIAESEEVLLASYRRYNDILREIAAEMNVDLLDLEASFNQHDTDELFLGDQVHANSLGRRLISDLLLAHFGRMGVLSGADLQRIRETATYDSRSPNVLRSRIEFVKTPLRATAGQPATIAIRAGNTGDTTWLARGDLPFGSVAFEVVVSDLQGQPLFDRERAALPNDVQPGQTIETRLTLRAVAQEGRYVVEVEPVAEGVASFREMGDEPATATLIVDPPGGSPHVDPGG